MRSEEFTERLSKVDLERLEEYFSNYCKYTLLFINLTVDVRACRCHNLSDIFVLSPYS